LAHPDGGTTEPGRTPADLRATFDSVADQYDAARPDYPPELFDRLVTVTATHPGDHLLEVGPGTGKATEPLARRGFTITAVELGGSLAAYARRRLAGYGDVVVEHAAFEAWTPPRRFDLVYAATTWHWVDPSVAYERAAAALRPGGHLAVWSAMHVVPDGGDDFFADLQDVYDEIGEGLPPGTTPPRPADLAPPDLEGSSGGLFRTVDVSRFDWETRYTAEEYVALLETFSGHIAMQAWQRERLYGEIRRRLSARPDRSLRRHWGVVLEVARVT
jgi:SAM-dependent methyltransferase